MASFQCCDLKGAFMGYGLSGETRVSTRQRTNPTMQMTMLGGTTAAFATNVGIATVLIGTPLDDGAIAGALHEEGLAFGASGTAQGEAAGAA